MKFYSLYFDIIWVLNLVIGEDWYYLFNKLVFELYLFFLIDDKYSD